MTWLPIVKKYDDMFTRFNTMHEHDRHWTGSHRTTAFVGRAYAGVPRQKYVHVRTTYAVKSAF